MAISRKPTGTKPQAVDVEALIRKGGSVASENKPQRKTNAVVLRIPTHILGQVDEAVLQKPLPIPRHQWILEAILEKLKRESD